MITFNDIYESSRKERNSEKLQKLPGNFIEEIAEYLRFAGIKTVLIFVLGFFMATFLAKLFKLNKADQITITVETVLQNGAMGFVIGALIFDDIKYVMPIAAYALLQYIFLLVYFTYVKKILDK